MQAGPLSLALVALCAIAIVIYFCFIFTLDEKMPRLTSRTFSCRLAIILLSPFAAIATEFGIATALADRGGYVFMASYRIDAIIAATWGAIGIFLLSIYDVYTYKNLPKGCERGVLDGLS